MATRLPGTYTRAAADAAGMTRAQLRDDGIRVTRGGYVSRAAELTVRNACAAVLPLLPTGAAFSHRTAAALLGAPVPHRWPLAVSVPPGVYRPRRARLRVHVRALDGGDVAPHRALPLTTGPQTWLDLATELPPEELVAVGDALYRAKHLDAERLAERLRRAGGTRGVVLARRLAPLLTPLAASRPESLVRFWVIDGGLPVPVPQIPIHDRWGRVVAHGDLGFPEWKVLVEYDGRHHALPGQFGRDVDRYSLMAADGWLLVRLGGTHLRRGLVIDRVGRALWSRGARW